MLAAALPSGSRASASHSMVSTTIPTGQLGALGRPVRGIPTYLCGPSCSGISPLSSSFYSHRERHHGRLVVVSSLQAPKGKGFGKKAVVVKKSTPPPEVPTASGRSPVEEATVASPQDIDEEDAIPEVVTNRMLKRIALTVGTPLALGVLFFPLFYYLKVVARVDIPEWLPLLVSMSCFGAAGFGITYGVISSSWDPSREGSLLGWKEAQLNWPVFWETVQGKKK